MQAYQQFGYGRGNLGFGFVGGLGAIFFENIALQTQNLNYSFHNQKNNCNLPNFLAEASEGAIGLGEGGCGEGRC